MFNTYNTNHKINNILKINAVSGGIYKTYRESWFKQFDLTSDLAHLLFRQEGCRYSNHYNWYLTNKNDSEYEKAKEVVVLQMVICGDMKVIAEIMYKEDFDKYFETTIGEMEEKEECQK